MAAAGGKRKYKATVSSVLWSEGTRQQESAREHCSEIREKESGKRKEAMEGKEVGQWKGEVH